MIAQLIIRAIQFCERDEIFEPMQIVIVPATIFLTCLAYGAM